MTAEQELFLSCLSDFCSGEETEPRPGLIDYDKLFQIAEEQSLASVIYEQYCRRIPSNGRFHSAFLSDVFLSVNRKHLLEEILSHFSEAGIAVIAMKGSVFRDYYPVPALRSMGDIDLIIHPEDRKKSDEIMTNVLGYHRMVDNHAVWTYWTGYIMFEIHDHMFYESLTSRFDYRGYFDHVWDHVKPGTVFGLRYDNLLVPEDSFHFLYLMAHSAKHIINKGSGFRAFLDMALMAHNDQASLNWSWICWNSQKLVLLFVNDGFRSRCH